jgi:hypothetical protein
MKSMDKNKKPFSFEDFEKGLMLAGYISPANSEEVRDKELLAEYDKEQAKEKKIIYFKRAVLAAEIVNEMQNERTFGRVKFQKLVYLCENVCEMGLNKRYAKFAAGPFDNKFMHSINSEFKKQKWFKVEYRVDGQYKVPVYKKLEKVDKYKEYYSDYFSGTDSLIKKILNIFRKEKTKQVELVATIFACLLELLETNSEIHKDDLIGLVYSWSKEKQKYSKSEIISTYDWMIANDISPF